jgi:hypothetical protein
MDRESGRSCTEPVIIRWIADAKRPRACSIRNFFQFSPENSSRISKRRKLIKWDTYGTPSMAPRRPQKRWLTVKNERPLTRVGGVHQLQFCIAVTDGGWTNRRELRWTSTRRDENHLRAKAAARRRPSGSAENSSEDVLIDDRHRTWTAISHCSATAGCVHCTFICSADQVFAQIPSAKTAPPINY